MRVAVTLTIDGTKETVIEGEARFSSEDKLEAENIGFWLDKYCFVEPSGKRYRQGRVFCPWTSVLYMEDISQ
jgi:hypothetical protein